MEESIWGGIRRGNRDNRHFEVEPTIPGLLCQVFECLSAMFFAFDASQLTSSEKVAKCVRSSPYFGIQCCSIVDSAECTIWVESYRSIVSYFA